MSDSSHRQVLRSSVVVGSASFVSIVVGVVRMKAAALLVGAVGVGLVGLYLNLIAAAASIAGLGLNASAVREIAAADARSDKPLLDSSRRALVWSTTAAAILGAVMMMAFRDAVAERLLADVRLAGEVGWLSIGVVLTIMSSTATVLLNGFRRTTQIAWAQVGGAVLGTAVGLTAFAIWREHGLIAYVLAAPATALLVNAIFTMTLPRISTRPDAKLIFHQFRLMTALGLAFMLSTVALSISVLLVRSVIEQRLGGLALGHFAATWSISNLYVGFVLQAMSIDYYPRLSALMDDAKAANDLVNVQIEAAVLLATPVLLVTLAAAPWLLSIAYSHEFRAAAGLLRWQIAGDIFKIMCWPLSMALLAQRRGKTYLSAEVLACVILATVTWLTIDYFGLASAGISYLGMYLCMFVALLTVSRHRLHSRAVAACVISTACVLSVFVVSTMSDVWGLVAGCTLTPLCIAIGWRRLAQARALPSIIDRWWVRLRKAG